MSILPKLNYVLFNIITIFILMIQYIPFIIESRNPLLSQTSKIRNIGKVVYSSKSSAMNFIINEDYQEIYCLPIEEMLKVKKIYEILEEKCISDMEELRISSYYLNMNVYYMIIFLINSCLLYIFIKNRINIREFLGKLLKSSQCLVRNNEKTRKIIKNQKFSLEIKKNYGKYPLLITNISFSMLFNYYSNMFQSKDKRKLEEFFKINGISPYKIMFLYKNLENTQFEKDLVYINSEYDDKNQHKFLLIIDYIIILKRISLFIYKKPNKINSILEILYGRLEKMRNILLKNNTFIINYLSYPFLNYKHISNKAFLLFNSKSEAIKYLSFIKASAGKDILPFQFKSINPEIPSKPNDLIMENLGINENFRNKKIIYSILVSIILVSACFFIMFLLSILQIVLKMEKIIIFPVLIGIFTSYINYFLRNFLEKLTVQERQMRISFHNISLYIKTSVLNILVSVILPYLSYCVYKNEDLFKLIINSILKNNLFQVPFFLLFSFEKAVKIKEKVRNCLKCLLKKKVSSKEQDDCLVNKKNRIYDRYSHILKVLFFCFFYKCFNEMMIFTYMISLFFILLIEIMRILYENEILYENDDEIVKLNYIYLIVYVSLFNYGDFIVSSQIETTLYNLVHDILNCQVLYIRLYILLFQLSICALLIFLVYSHFDCSNKVLYSFKEYLKYSRLYRNILYSSYLYKISSLCLSGLENDCDSFYKESIKSKSIMSMSTKESLL